MIISSLKLSKFAYKVAFYKIPKKMIKDLIKVEKYNLIISNKSLSFEALGLSLSNVKITKIMNSNFEKVDNQFFKLE